MTTPTPTGLPPPAAAPAYVVLCGLGAAMGAVHVLTGPDHLSALAALSAGSPATGAFWIGCRWGVGHSSGLLLAAAVLVAAGSAIDAQALAHGFEYVVGVFMVALGAYQVRHFRAKASAARRANDSRGDYAPVGGPPRSLPPKVDGAPRTCAHCGTALSAELSFCSACGRADDFVPPSKGTAGASARGSSESLSTVALDYRQPIAAPPLSPTSSITGGSSTSSSAPLPQTSTQRFAACGIGVVHGIAGPGGALGILPAMQMSAVPTKAAVYLGAFAAGRGGTAQSAGRRLRARTARALHGGARNVPYKMKSGLCSQCGGGLHFIRYILLE